MLQKLLQKVFFFILLKRKFFKKFITKSYNKITFDEDLYLDYFNYFEARYYGEDIHALIYEELVKKNINQKIYNNIYILTDIDYEINLKKIKHLEIKRINSTENLKKEEINNSFFFILFNSDDLVLPHLKNIIENKGFFKSLDYSYNKPTIDFSRATSYRFVNKKCLEAIKKTFEQKKDTSGNNLTTLNTHENICEALEITKNVEGDYLEIGVYEGGSALTALNYLNQINLKKKTYLLDTFEGFNYKDSENSSDVIWHKSHFIDNEEKTKVFLKEILKDFSNYELITNNICKDDLPEKIKSISLAHIDVDLYEATLEAIKKVSRRLSKNGIIMCEDPVNTPVLYGALYAMENFLKSEEGKGFIKIFKKNHYFLMKQN
ncbi:TylF/MycF family methyltransferase [Candidatus Pelagibacter sp.]|jgi:hypothetical protein|nr:TylF/MycF family methyltransferase [Candidatus Pelagibacter sp.]MDB4081301.1 TylF/MycF family methyltransferase [Candidatus Pelagibacter sp.]